MNLFRRHPKSLKLTTPNPATLECESLEPRMMLSAVEVIAAGTTGVEELELQIDGQTVEVLDDLGDGAYEGDFRSFAWSTDETVTVDQVRLQFTNDLYDEVNGIDRNVRIDMIRIDGVAYQAESQDVFSTGTWKPEDGISPGYRESEYLHGAGYFQFAGDNNAETTLITVNAAGSEGDEAFAQEVDGEIIRTWQNVSTEETSYEALARGTVTADQIRVVFLNDEYNPDNGIDRNLIVNNIDVEDDLFETEADNVFSTGTWLPEDGIVDGFRNSEVLHTNGYFRYDADPVVAEPGTIGLTLESVSVNDRRGSS